MWFFFFFSSRRRHTRFDCDWSSDVCSSDLELAQRFGAVGGGGDREPRLAQRHLEDAQASGVRVGDEQALLGQVALFSTGGAAPFESSTRALGVSRLPAPEQARQHSTFLVLSL